MQDKYQNIQWVVQRNFTGEDILQELKNACADIGVDYLEVEVIPFTPELPSFPTLKKSIFYGSITLNKLVYNNPDLNEGFFFNENFSIKNYISKWGSYMLNSDAEITSFRDLMNKDYDEDRLLFIRPDGDTKSFAGEVKTFSQISKWYNVLTTFENADLNLDTKIVVAEPYNIKSEWRLWMINGEMVSASKYREQFKLKKEHGCPKEVKDFAEDRCKEYMPHDCFVMDIGLCGDTYYIIECGCINGAGFYKANIKDITLAMTNYFSNKLANS